MAFEVQEAKAKVEFYIVINFNQSEIVKKKTRVSENLI